jgi:uncharacterized membrane protein
MSAKILSYSRSKGVFAGLELEGATLNQDGKANKVLYGKEIEARDILAGKVKSPAAAQPVLDVLAKYSPVAKPASVSSASEPSASSGTTATDAGTASPAVEAPAPSPAPAPPPAADAASAAAQPAPAAESSTSVWLWVVGFLIIAIVAYYVVRSFRSGTGQSGGR